MARPKREIKPGTRFGRLTIIEEAEPHVYPSGIHRVFKCKCDCGNVTYAMMNDLQKGSTTSCGCARIKHNCSNHPAYTSYTNMMHRCYDKDFPEYLNYGGRGITVCDEWKDHPNIFCEWADENGFKPGLTIDRIDVHGNYSLENCRWITKAAQQRNRRNNTKVFDTFTNKEYNTIAEASIDTGVSFSSISKQLHSGSTKARFKSVDELYHRIYKRAVRCIETNQIFDSIADCGRYFNVTRVLIGLCCADGRAVKKLGGKHFEYCELDNSDDTYYNILELAQGVA